MKRFFILLIGGFTPLFLWAQGALSGTVLDAKYGDPLIGANIVVEGTSTGTSTDFDGKYQFKLDAGTYTIIVSYIGYADQKFANIKIEDGQTTYLDAALGEDAQALEEVIVVDKVIDKSENALMLLQMRSDKIQDGISAQEMSKFSVGDAAGALKKVTGATVSGGKYIYIRGLGDRYSLSQLNGLVIPSTDPYRNGAPLDLIPSNLLDNIITAKTFTPDQPGTFTGGNVDIKTKSFPEQFFLTASLSAGYNSQNNLIDNFLTYQGGSTDYLGYDDGARSRPSLLSDPEVQSVLNTQAPLIARLNLKGNGKSVATRADQAVKSLNHSFVPSETSTPLDHGVSLSFGNQYQLSGQSKLGVILSASHKQNYAHLNKFQKANWKLEDINTGTLRNQGDFEDTRSTQNPVVNGLAGLAYQFNNRNDINFNLIYNHNTEKESRFIFGERPDNITTPDFLEGRSLSFMERELINYQLGGSHAFEKLNELRIDWKASLANSSLIEPDTRFFENQYNEEFNSYSIPASNIQRPFHFFRDLADQQIDAKLDFTLPFSKNKSNKIRFGGLISQKDRSFKEWRYQIEEHVGYTEAFTGDVNQYLKERNLGIISTDVERDRYILGNYLVDRTEPRNNYQGKNDVTAFYGMVNYNILENLRFIGGARYEKTEIFVQSEDANRQAGNIDEVDILPSANLVYSFTENMNVRASYSQTLARPNLREIAPFESFDPLTKELFIGNPELRKSDIRNFDLRWEWFFGRGEILAVSGYYKGFIDPITLLYRRAPNPEIQFTNVDQGTLYGLEFEFRKELGTILPFLSNFKLNTNLSLIKSSTNVVNLTNFEPEERPFEGQSPYIVNVALLYTDLDYGFDVVLALNSIGDRLSIIGREGTPDIYDRGRTQLDFTLIKKVKQYMDVKFTVQNLLNADYILSSQYLGTEYIYSRFNRGISFGVGLSYTLK